MTDTAQAQSVQFVCPKCTERLGLKIVSASPVCRRCTGLCKIEGLGEEVKGAPSEMDARVAVEKARMLMTSPRRLRGRRR